MAKWTGKRANVVYSKPDEPSFLKQFKEKVGYKDDSGVSEKFREMPKATDEDLEDADDELPQVVQLNPGDLTEEEYKRLAAGESKGTHEDEDKKDECLTADGKIMFRKPDKRDLENKNDLKLSSKKRKRKELPKVKGAEGDDDKLKKDKTKTASNKKLLSFDDDDEDDNDDDN